jgi:molybdopterin converting factor small subunit
MSDRPVTVLFFAGARDATGTAEWRCEARVGETVAGLRGRVFEAFPRLKSWAGSLRFAVDGAYAEDGTTVPAGAEVAVIPPVAGG